MEALGQGGPRMGLKPSHAESSCVKSVVSSTSVASGGRLPTWNGSSQWSGTTLEAASSSTPLEAVAGRAVARPGSRSSRARGHCVKGGTVSRAALLLTKLAHVKLALLLAARHRRHLWRLHHGECLLLQQQQRSVRRVRAHVVPAALLLRRLTLRAALPPALIVPVVSAAVSPVIASVSSIVVSAVVVPVSAIVIPTAIVILTAIVVLVVRTATSIGAIGPLLSPAVVRATVRPVVRATAWLRASIRSAALLTAIVRVVVSIHLLVHTQRSDKTEGPAVNLGTFSKFTEASTED